MRSPSTTRNEPRRPHKLRDKAGGLGYNRDLIGVVQALRSGYGASRSIFLQNASQSRGAGSAVVAIGAAGEWDKEVP
jgi:hypothetical protein